MIDPRDPDFEMNPAVDERARFEYAAARTDAHPAVTFVTPFFDTAPQAFADAARSVKRQSLQQWEWLIVDDGSRSASAKEALSALEASDPRIRVIRHGTNRGVSAARNTAIREARAPHVLLLDSDDMIEPTTAEKWLWHLASHPEHAFVNGFEVVFGDERFLWKHGFRDRDAFLLENFVGARCMVRRDVLLEVGGFDEAITQGFEDWELWLRCADSGYWGGTVPECLSWYRARAPEANRERWANWDRGEAQKTFRKALSERYPGLWRNGFPDRAATVAAPHEIELDALPVENALEKEARRLLLILPWTAMGGADKFNLDLVSRLISRGWETTIVTTLDGDHSWLSQFTRLTPDVFALSHLLKPEDYPRFLRYVIRSRNPDAILISHSLFAYDALAYLRSVAGNTPILDYNHIVEERWLNGGYPRRSIRHQQQLDLQVASSEALKRWMIGQGGIAERIQVCYTGIEPRETAGRPSRAELGLPENVPIIVYPGRIAEQKQPPVFARTMRELRRRRHRFLAVAVGDGPYLPWLRGFVRRHGLTDCVRCLGSRSNAYVQDLIAAADLVFIPSTHEGISLAFYEALAAGVPVVGADVGGQRELVTPDCGVLLPRADSQTEVRRYADVLGGLLADPGRRQAMGEAGRARIGDGFTLEQMGDRMEALIERASELAVRQPRRVPSAEEVRAAALDGVRTVWWTKPAPASSTAVGGLSYRVRHQILRVLTVAGTPVYRAGMLMGLHWLEPLKDRVYYALFPEHRTPGVR